MKSTIVLPDDQLALVRDGDEIVLCIPLRKQPPDEYEFEYHEQGSMLFSSESPKGIWLNWLRYPIGQELRIKDTFELVKVVDVRVKKVWNTTIGERCELLGKCSIIGSEDTYTEYRREVVDEFANWFNAKFSKPCKRVKNGKIVGYECWCWDRNSFFDLYKDNPKLQHDIWTSRTDLKEAWGWEDKPLEIHPNPFMLLTTVKEVK